MLTENEYRTLLRSLPRAIPRKFATVSSRSLKEDYLPKRALFPDRSWLEIPPQGRPFRHFTDYDGRSFVKVFMRAPGRSLEQISALWADLYGKYGEQLHISHVPEETPPGLETMLVRTFGVFLENGSYRDSFWPEEVIIRVFKYPAAQLDMTTSDFRGTIFYRYRMVRAALLNEPPSLGLKRIHDDDLQYFGFLGDVPDRRNAYSTGVTTMRCNCIGCHSELFYGLPTIFSFERDPHFQSKNTSPGGDMLQVRSVNDYELTTKEYQSLKKWFDTVAK
jgi:hypothetical protein